jgi:hypothetical protein
MLQLSGSVTILESASSGATGADPPHTSRECAYPPSRPSPARPTGEVLCPSGYPALALPLTGGGKFPLPFDGGGCGWGRVPHCFPHLNFPPPGGKGLYLPLSALTMREGPPPPFGWQDGDRRRGSSPRRHVCGGALVGQESAVSDVGVGDGIVWDRCAHGRAGR